MYCPDGIVGFSEILFCWICPLFACWPYSVPRILSDYEYFPCWPQGSTVLYSPTESGQIVHSEPDSSPACKHCPFVPDQLDLLCLCAVCLLGNSQSLLATASPHHGYPWYLLGYLPPHFPHAFATLRVRCFTNTTHIFTPVTKKATHSVGIRNYKSVTWPPVACTPP